MVDDNAWNHWPCTIGFYHEPSSIYWKGFPRVSMIHPWYPIQTNPIISSDIPIVPPSFFVKSWYPQYTIIFLGEITTCTRQKPSSRWKKPTPSFCRGTADPQISLFWGLCLQLLVICSLRSLGDEGWKVDMLMVKWVACGRYWFMAGLWQTYMIVGEICG